MNDTLIRADDIVEHYNVLSKHHPELAYIRVFEGFSHVDFTYQSHHAMLNEILFTLKNVKKGNYRELRKNKDISLLRSLTHVDL